MSKAAKLRALLRQPSTVVAVGAHDALSARLIESFGFSAVWVSSFTVSAAQRAMPDVNLLTMTENLEVARSINDSVGVPVIADCDNGYGNAINVMRIVEAYEKAGIAGVSIEDNVFPKRCSLYPGVRRELATVAEHAGKIRAAKRVQRDPNFVVIARTEALIAGWGMPEALKRAHAYAEAGADMIFIHSKAPTASEVLEFMQRWKQETPIVVVPTMFPSVRLEDLEAAGVKLVIFANQVLRGAVKGMQQTLDVMAGTRHLEAATPHIVSLEEIYRLVGVSEFKAYEAEFLPSGADQVRAVIIAAGSGKSLLPLTEERPKCLLEIKGRSILERQLETLRACGIHDVVVVRGYRKEKVTLPALRYYDNDRYEETGELYSLFIAEPELQGRLLFLYSDILFDETVLQKLLRSRHDVAIAVDRSWPDYRDQLLPLSKPMDLVITRNPSEPRHRFLSSEDEDTVVRVGQRIPPEEATGEFIGMALFSERGCYRLREIWARLRGTHRGAFHEVDSLEQASFTDLLQELVEQGETVSCANVYKGWLEVDTFEDYQRAWAEVRT